MDISSTLPSLPDRWKEPLLTNWRIFPFHFSIASNELANFFMLESKSVCYLLFHVPTCGSSGTQYLIMSTQINLWCGLWTVLSNAKIPLTDSFIKFRITNASHFSIHFNLFRIAVSCIEKLSELALQESDPEFVHGFVCLAAQMAFQVGICTYYGFNHATD